MIDAHHLYPPEDKRERFGDGPWIGEPDRVEWRAEVSHYPCLALRHPEFGNWCGYVGLPPGHPSHGADFNAVDVGVHGGLTFAHKCQEGGDLRTICHVPRFDEPADVWWLGFDCSHCFDLIPGLVMTLKRLPQRLAPLPDIPDLFSLNVYRDLHYVMQEVDALARQLWERR
jgi:hypothetical protein